MADAESTVKPKGQLLVEQIIELKDTNPSKANKNAKNYKMNLMIKKSIELSKPQHQIKLTKKEKKLKHYYALMNQLNLLHYLL